MVNTRHSFAHAQQAHVYSACFAGKFDMLSFWYEYDMNMNKHEAEQSEKLSKFKGTTVDAVLQKLLHWTQLNVKEIVTCTRCGFSVPSFSTNLPKKSWQV